MSEGQHQKRVLVVLGTRPEAVKLAPLLLAARKSESTMSFITCSAGQHPELVHEVFEDFKLTIDFDLTVMRPGQSLSELSMRLYEKLPEVISLAEPDLVVVHGDTTTAFVAATVAFFHRVPVAHVEAGLRTGSIHAPFPEEFNRRGIAILAALNFAPTELSRENLLSEGVPDDSIFIVGNTVVDAMKHILDNMDQPGSRQDLLTLTTLHGDSAEITRDEFVLVTLHRRENHGLATLQVISAISHLAQEFSELLFVIPVHHNPAVRVPLVNSLQGFGNVLLVEPQRYPNFVWMLAGAKVVLTDSGGIQEESVSLGRKVFVMRESSERPEGLSSGLLKLIGTSVESIKSEVSRELAKPIDNVSLLSASPYGDGFSSRRILRVIASYLNA